MVLDGHVGERESTRARLGIVDDDFDEVPLARELDGSPLDALDSKGPLEGTLVDDSLFENDPHVGVHERAQCEAGGSCKSREHTFHGTEVDQTVTASW